jgi:hypothetical protein
MPLVAVIMTLPSKCQNEKVDHYKKWGFLASPLHLLNMTLLLAATSLLLVVS